MFCLKGDKNMFRFKIDVIQELKERGYTSYTIRNNGNAIGQKTFMDMKKGIVPGIKTLDALCHMLNMNIGDIIEYVPDSDTSNN
jgi:DNA-binding Xre family transcriptional regulator